MVLAHRVAYCEHHGLALSDIDGKVVRHTCDHPPCINPAHLLLGTQSENMDDMTSRHRARNQHGEQTDLETARQIRALYVPGSKELGCRALARKFGISKAVVSRIVNNLICKEQV